MYIFRVGREAPAFFLVLAQSLAHVWGLTHCSSYAMDNYVDVVYHIVGKKTFNLVIWIVVECVRIIVM